MRTDNKTAVRHPSHYQDLFEYDAYMHGENGPVGSLPKDTSSHHEKRPAWLHWTNTEVNCGEAWETIINK